MLEPEQATDQKAVENSLFTLGQKTKKNSRRGRTAKQRPNERTNDTITAKDGQTIRTGSTSTHPSDRTGNNKRTQP